MHLTSLWRWGASASNRDITAARSDVAKGKGEWSMEWKDSFAELLHELLYEPNMDKILFNYFYRESQPGELMCEMHQHNSLEVDCVLEGDVYLHFENEAAHLKKDELILIRPNEKHLFRSGDNGCIRANIQLNTYRLKNGSLDRFIEYALGLRQFVKLKKNVVVGALVRDISLEMSQKEVAYTTIVKMNVVSVLIHLLREIQSDIQYANKPSNSYVLKAIELIHNMLGEDVAPGDIADKLHLSEGHLMRLFKMETGYSIMKYLTLCRIEESKRQLIHTSKRVCDIAVDVGLPNVQHFSMLFKKHIGISPLNFRKMSRKIKGADIEVTQRPAAKL